MLEREPDIEVVGLSQDADDAISRSIAARPDVVIMDIDMPGLSCFEAIRIIRSRVPETRFLLVTAYPHDEHIEQALRVKTDGFISKNEGIRALSEAVRDVADGRVHFAPELMNRLVFEGGSIRLDNPPKSRLGSLTPRERELLRVLAHGISLKEAARVMGVSYKTVDKQKVSLMAKLDIHNRVDLARYAIREGLVEP
jgi:DNA-binding NarL/FixJ family response regulator